jgi:hypothetical protein
MFTIGLLAGLFIGAFLGLMLMSLLIMSRTSSRFDLAEREENIFREGMPETSMAYPTDAYSSPVQGTSALHVLATSNRGPKCMRME